MNMSRARWSTTVVFLILIGLVGVTWFVLPYISSQTFDELLEQRVISDLRQPRIVLGMIAGCGLALAGMTFQALFRNPLATPFTLGVSSGATLAIAIFGTLGFAPDWMGGVDKSLVAALGAGVVIAAVYGVAQLRPESPTSTLLLAGVSINFICGAGIILTQYIADVHEARRLVGWLLGNLNAASEQTVSAMWFIGSGVAVAAVVLTLCHRELDLLMMGEIVAGSRGVNVRRIRALGYFCASLLTAGVVSLCGPIAFVGLLVPHTMRSLVGPSHRVLIPACALMGISLLPLCDCLARNIMAWSTAGRNATELPVGVMTNVLGGIFFLIILVRNRQDRPLVA